jgi:hypothetical protein
MKKEFIQLIQSEVRTQIKNEMSAMQTEVVNLGIKIDSIQTSIRESIGAAIRDGLQKPVWVHRSSSSSSRSRISQGSTSAMK